MKNTTHTADLVPLKVWSELNRKQAKAEPVPSSVLSQLNNIQPPNGLEPQGIWSTIDNAEVKTSSEPMVFLWVSTADIVPLQTWCNLNNKNPSTVRSWKTNRRIIEGTHVFKDPSGHLWISCSAMQEWVESNYKKKHKEREERKYAKEIKIPRGRRPRQTLKTSNTLKVI